MPQWIKTLLVKIFIKIILDVLKDYLSEEEHVVVSNSIKTKINHRA